MIKFFRDILDGPLYYIIAILAIIFIMAIIGFIMERKKFEKEAKSKIAVVGDEIIPIVPVEIQEDSVNVGVNDSVNEVVQIPDDVNFEVQSDSVETKDSFIIFSDEEKKEVE